MNDYDDDLPPLPRAGGPVAGRKPLGKLTQSARGAELGKARRILLVIGVLMFVGNIIGYCLAETLADQAIKVELDKQPGAIVDPAFREAVINATKIASVLVALLGALFAVFGLIVQKFPVPITVASLVLYIGQVAVFAVLAPSSLLNAGIFVKVIIIVALVKAVQAAIAMQREEREAGGSYA